MISTQTANLLIVGRKYVPEESDKELQIMAMYYILNVSIRPFFIESAEIKVSGM